MLATYKAQIRDGRVQWRDAAPPITAKQKTLDVLVTVLHEEPETESTGERGKKMAEALRQIAAENGLAEITDPVQWEREIRRDRSLPGRDE